MAHSKRGDSETPICQMMEAMHHDLYLPEKYMFPFLMEFFFSQKYESLIVSFDDSLLLLTRVKSCDLDL